MSGKPVSPVWVLSQTRVPSVVQSRTARRTCGWSVRLVRLLSSARLAVRAASSSPLGVCWLSMRVTSSLTSTWRRTNSSAVREPSSSACSFRRALSATTRAAPSATMASRLTRANVVVSL